MGKKVPGRNLSKREKLIVLTSPQSLDLNPIEHLWNDLKKRLASSKCSTIVQLKPKIIEEYEKTDRNYLQKLIESMPRRCKAVIKAKGGHIKY